MDFEQACRKIKSAKDFNELHKLIHNCPFEKCPRQKSATFNDLKKWGTPDNVIESIRKSPTKSMQDILLGRIPFHYPRVKTEKVKVLFITQDPAHQLREWAKNIESVFHDGIEFGKFLEKRESEKWRKGEVLDKNTALAKIRKKFSEEISKNMKLDWRDLSNGEVYWTHTLKCVAYSNEKFDKDFRQNDVKKYAKCILEKELEIFKNLKVILTFGGPAWNTLMEIFKNNDSKNDNGKKAITHIISKYKIETPKRINVSGKEMPVFPFVHPTDGYRHVASGRGKGIEEMLRDKNYPKRPEIDKRVDKNSEKYPLYESLKLDFYDAIRELI